MKKVYFRSERARSNCSGKANKRPLSPRRLAAVKKAVYGIHPVQPGQKEKDPPQVKWGLVKCLFDRARTITTGRTTCGRKSTTSPES